MSTVLHPTPRWSAVIREQICATGIAIRRESALAAGLLVAVMALVVTSYLLGEGSSFDFHLSEMTFPAVALGFFVPMAVWKGEEPSRRAYLWTLPVNRASHTLMKVLGGWIWFMILVGGYVLWGVALALLTDGNVGAEETRYLLADLAPGIRPTAADYHIHRLDAPAWMWFVPFTAATTTYLMGTLVLLTSDHPWRWFATVIVGYLLIGALAQAGQAGSVGRAVQAATDGRYGMEVLFTGVSNQPADLVRRDGTPVTIMLDVPSRDLWLLATLLWGGLSLIGVLAVAYRHQER